MRVGLLTILIFCLLTVVAVIVFSRIRRDCSRGLFFVVLCVGSGLYILGSILMAPGFARELALAALALQNAGQTLMAPFFLLFVMDTCHLSIRPWVTNIAFLYAALVFFGTLFYDSYGLLYSSVEFLQVGDLRYPVLDYGVLFIAHQAIQAVCVAFAYALLISRLRKRPYQSRRLLQAVFFASLPAVTASLFIAIQVIPPAINPLPVTLTLSILLFMVGIPNFWPLNMADAVIRSMDNAVLVIDDGWRCLYSNVAAQQLFPQLTDLNGLEPICGMSDWPAALDGSSHQVEFCLEDKVGRERHYHAQVSRIDENTHSPDRTVIIRDVTETVEAFNRLTFLATTDYLTGLYNRRHFIEAVRRDLEMAKREGNVSALIILDIDHFKKINDTYGHQTGDTALRMLADTINRELRPYDIFARYGGEEFALYIVKISIQDAEKFTWRLCHAVEGMQIPHQDKTVQITASFGLVEVRSCHSVENAVAAADKALYKAKEKGRNQVVVGQVAETPGSDPLKPPSEHASVGEDNTWRDVV